jgi:UDP-glucuronate 4-epimerase
MRVLVTGGAGFIGSHLCDALLLRGDTVTALDNFDPYYDPKLKWANIEPAQDHLGFALVEGDIRDTELVGNLLARGQFDAVVHLAALAGVRESLEYPFTFNEVNVDGTINLMDAAVKHGGPRFILASTSSVYGLSPAIPYVEYNPLLDPVTPYGASKIAAEKYGSVYHHVHGLPVLSLRLFTAYGERQRPDMAIHKFASAIIDGTPLTMYGDGSTSRDYTYVGDVIGGFLGALDCEIPHGVYNIGNNVAHKLADVIAMLEEVIGRKANIEQLPEQPGDPPHTWADISAAQRDLGYSPATDFAEGIRRFVDWLR